MYVSSGLVGDQRLGEQGGEGAMMQQQQQHLNGVVGSRNYSPDPINPDLINDTEKQRLAAIGHNSGNNNNNSSGSSSNNNKNSQTNLYCNNNNNNNTSGPNLEDAKLREFVSQSYNRPPMQLASHLGTLPRTRILSAAADSSDHHQHQADVHLNPSCFLTPQQSLMSNGGGTATGELPVEYSLTNVMAVLPSATATGANRQLVGQQQLQSQLAGGAQSMNFTYRTLPHRMKIRNGGGGSNNSLNATNPGPTIRFTRDAEFLTTLPPQPHSFDMYTPANVRYTAEGYPYTPFLAMQPLPGGLQATIATTQQVVAFQDPTQMQFLPSPPEGYKMTDSNNGGGGGEWPACLPGYHHQTQTGSSGQSVPTSQIVPIKTNFGQRFASPLASPASSVTSSTSTSTNATSSTNGNATQQCNNMGSVNVISTGNQTPVQLQSPSVTGSQLPLHTPPPPVITKRCVAAQTMMMRDEDPTSSSSSTSSTSSSCGPNCNAGQQQQQQVVSRRMGLLANATTTLKDVDETEEETEDGEQEEDLQKERQHSQRGTCRHLNGPLADSPDEGYVGDSGHDGNGNSE